MEDFKPCRCCLAQGSHKDLNFPYFWLDQKEIYSKMLQECFNIVLSRSPQYGNGICEVCVISLRAALAFKQSILTSEEELLKKSVLIGCHEEKPELSVKLEPRYASGDDDSDDYFLADAVREPQIKLELPTEYTKKKSYSRSKKNMSKRSREPAMQWNEDEDVKDLVSKLNSGNKGLTIKKKKESSLKKYVNTVKLSPDQTNPNKKKLKLIYRSRWEKLKHMDNLSTILEYSNVVPFKDKGILGYLCDYCDSTYPDPKDLRTHTENDHKSERLNLLKTSFDKTEFKVNFDVTDLTCTLCGDMFVNLNDLKEHLVNIHDKTIHYDIKDHMLQFKLKKGDTYDCAMCSATYETFKMLKQHMNIHYSNYACNKCESSFATKRSLTAHNATHLEGSFKCDHCDKVFPSDAKKRYHEKSKHLGNRNISNCPYCNEPFRSYYQRNQHMVKVHNAEAPYKCNICDKSYILKSLLMAHIKKSHLMERNCQCSECGYRFFSQKSLKAHMVKHTGEKNYACTICNKAYARKYTLREHMRIHNNDRRFKCDVCSMSFVQKCSLKSHLLSNHGISMAASDITSVDANV
ncbi:zinc-finger associated domain (zf-AD) domain-containing protein [Phthorimaea operculella]|nr:zinc-finger associated domain (zf-AD) domain-containing protein [Phthorimaea operculella]